jgi:hypothetical protein
MSKCQVVNSNNAINSLPTVHISLAGKIVWAVVSGGTVQE